MFKDIIQRCIKYVFIYFNKGFFSKNLMLKQSQYLKIIFRNVMSHLEIYLFTVIKSANAGVKDSFKMMTVGF